jgi:hypothetical protein
MVGVEDAFPVAAGQTELELGYLYSTAARAFDDGGDTFRRGDNETHVGGFFAKHGFTSFLDAGIGIFGAYLQDDDEPERSVTGLGDLFVNAKWRFFGDRKFCLDVLTFAARRNGGAVLSSPRSLPGARAPENLP